MKLRIRKAATGGAVAGRDALKGTSEQQPHYMPSQCVCQPTEIHDESH